jgi:Protein of unknown function (DUF4230)
LPAQIGFEAAGSDFCAHGFFPLCIGRGWVTFFAMRQLLAAVIVAAMLIAGVWLGFILANVVRARSSLHEENTAAVVQQVQALSDLVTVKYVVEKVVILDDVKWYGESRVLLLAHGIVKAGIDLKRLKPEDVRVSGKTIRIHLPPPQITDAYLDDKQTQVIDHTTDIERAARREGILDEANKRAELELALFLHSAGYDNIQFADRSFGIPTTNAPESVPQF